MGVGEELTDLGRIDRRRAATVVLRTAAGSRMHPDAGAPVSDALGSLPGEVEGLDAGWLRADDDLEVGEDSVVGVCSGGGVVEQAADHGLPGTQETVPIS